MVGRRGASEEGDREALRPDHLGEHLSRQGVPVAFGAGDRDQPGRGRPLDRVRDRVECLLSNAADQVLLGDGPAVGQPALAHFALGPSEQVDDHVVGRDAAVDEVEGQPDPGPAVTADGLPEVPLDRIGAEAGRRRAVTALGRNPRSHW